jgi:hypothetical protein
MENSNDKPDAGLPGANDREDRLSEATSNKTLSDLEETETDSTSTGTGLDPGPSPDGALDESDEIKDAGPM